MGMYDDMWVISNRAKANHYFFSIVHSSPRPLPLLIKRALALSAFQNLACMWIAQHSTSIRVVVAVRAAIINLLLPWVQLPRLPNAMMEHPGITCYESLSRNKGDSKVMSSMHLVTRPPLWLNRTCPRELRSGTWYSRPSRPHAM